MSIDERIRFTDQYDNACEHWPISMLYLINISSAKKPPSRSRKKLASETLVVYILVSKTLVETSKPVLLNLLNYACVIENRVPPI